MNLLLIRHAEAEPGDDDDDDARPLTPRGLRQVRRLARALEALDLRPDLLLHSPKRRAVETADGLARLARETEVTPELACRPGAGIVRILRGDCVVAVGHAPWLGNLVDLLAARGVARRLEWPTGGVVWLRGEPEPGRMAVRAVLPPRAVRALASRPSGG